MEQNINDIEKKLKKYSLFKTNEDIEKFDALLSQIAEKKNPEYIPLLMKIFDDNTEYPEVMYNVVHILEDYPDDVHATALIKWTPFMLNHAPVWLLTLVYATLNNPSSLASFKENIHLIPKESMIQLLDLVARESDDHKEVCIHLKEELAQNFK